MKPYLVLICVFFISSCSTLNSIVVSEKTIPNCYKSYVVTNKAIETGYRLTLRFSQEDMLTLEDVQKASSYLDQASAYADQASALCSLDIKAAYGLLSQADNLVGIAGMLSRKEIADE